MDVGCLSHFIVNTFESLIFNKGIMDFDLDIDIEYLHSVEKCDLKRSHELAFDYAKSMGYNVQSYHYSPNQFDEFTKGDIGFHFSRDRKVTYLRKDDIDG